MSPRISTSLVTFLSLLVLATSAFGAETPVLLLPGHVESEAGQVSIYADFGSVGTNGRVPIYVVNRSSEDIVLNAQDGSIYLMLEFQGESGNWIRAQGYWPSWCGNSYHRVPVPAGYYLLTSGYQPINGVGQTVRYRIHKQSFVAVSNIGQGVVAEADVQRAANDTMAVNDGDLEFVARIALGDAPAGNRRSNWTDMRHMAVRELSSERFDPEASRDVLLQVRERHPDLARVVDSALKRMEQRIATESDAPD